MKTDREREAVKEIGKLCKKYRKEVLKRTVQNMADSYQVPRPTLSTFENGRSTNIINLLYYIIASDTDDHLTKFLFKLDRIFKNA